MNKPVKLIRNTKAASLIINGKLLLEEIDREDNIIELRKLFILKIKEELAEVEASNFEDVNEIADLAQVVYDLIYKCTSYSDDDVLNAMKAKLDKDGKFDGTILTNLNPNNPSNKIYFNQQSL